MEECEALLYSQHSSDLEFSDETKALLGQRLQDYRPNEKNGKDGMLLNLSF